MTDHTRIPLTEETSLAVEIVDALATLTDSAPLELPPLYGSIDPAVIESIFGRGSGDCLRFTYEGHRVTLSRVDDAALRLSLDEESADRAP